MDWNSFASSFHDDSAAAVTEPANNRTGDVALLLHWPGLKQSLQRQHQQAPNLEKLLAVLDKYGTRGTARAYGDWTNNAYQADGFKLNTQGIEPLQVSAEASVRLAVEAMELCYTQDTFKTYVLVGAGDELLFLSEALKRKQRKVILVGMSDAIAPQQQSVDELLFYDKDVVALVAQTTAASAAAQGIDEVKGFVEALLQQKSSVDLPNLKGALEHLYNVDFASLGLPFNSLMKQMQEAKEIRLAKVGGKLHAALPSGAKAKPAQTQLITGIPAEINLLLQSLQGHAKPLPWAKVLASLKAKHKLPADFQKRVAKANKDGWVKLIKSKSGDMYITIGDRVP